jgi:hypothetical protein
MRPRASACVSMREHTRFAAAMQVLPRIRRRGASLVYGALSY